MPRVASAVTDYDGGLLAVTEPLLYLMPPVLMWSPMEQYSDLFPNGVKCPKCNSCGNDDGTLSCIGWKMVHREHHLSLESSTMLIELCY